MSISKTDIIKHARSLGFEDVRFARAQAMDVEKQRLQEWLDKGYHGTMAYMENHFEKRTNPTSLVPGAQTVICLSFNYHPQTEDQYKEDLKISDYALGRDYHKVIKKKLKALFAYMKDQDESVEGRYFVDSAPVLERDWARRSGLGWVGKNTLIIHPKKGSYFFLAELIVNLDIEPDEPISDYCGTCTKCIEACPTDAIMEEGYVMDGSKCISYLTIELKDDIPVEYKGMMEDYIYGCDICQEVCPWNRFSKPNVESDFTPKEDLRNMTRQDWEELTEDRFNELFFGSAVKRTGFQGLKRNIDFISSSE